MKTEPFKRAISQLPHHYAPDELWYAISKQLDEEQKLRKAINNLPEYQMNDDLWSAIENNLASGQKFRYFLNTKKQLLQIAAGLLILIGIGWGTSLAVRQPISGKIVYSQEIISPCKIEQEKPPSIIIEIDKEIEQICQLHPQQCKSSAFLALEKQLQEVKAVLKEVQLVLKESQNQQLQKYSKRLLNKKVEIKQQMMQLIMNE